MLEFIARGGIFMYPIIVCSIIALAVFFERLWVLRRIYVIPKKFIHSIEDMLKKDKISEALFLCQSNNSSISRIFQAGLKNAGKGMWFIKESIEERGGREAIILEKNIGILSTTANLTPLLGLLGTVSGLIKTFNVLSFHGPSDPTFLAGGIAEALITTAAGLTVAIPTLVGHRFLKDRVDSLIFEMEDRSLKLVELMDNINKK